MSDYRPITDQQLKEVLERIAVAAKEDWTIEEAGSINGRETEGPRTGGELDEVSQP